MWGTSSRDVIAIACVLGAAMALGGCSSVTTAQREGDTLPSRPAGCAFDVVTSRPAHEYRVVAHVAIESFTVKHVPRDEESFRTVVAADVCRLGGDAVIPGINTDGRYVLATVLAWTDVPCGTDAHAMDAAAMDAAATYDAIDEGQSP